jgi:hypothetical protein
MFDLCGQVLLESFNRILTIPAHNLEGMCWAKLESELTSEEQKRIWLSKEDHFVIVESNTKLVIKGIGLRLHEEELQRQETLQERNGVLRGLELFAGLYSIKYFSYCNDYCGYHRRWRFRDRVRYVWIC